GPWGGTGGNPFSSGVGSIHTIVVRSGKRIDRIELHFDDGHTDSFGGNGGTPNTFVVPSGTSLVGVTGRAGDRVDAIQFHFSNGDESSLYGGTGGKPYECNIPENCRFAGLF